MKLSALLFIGIGVAIGYFLATEDKDELIDNLKEGVAKGKDIVTNLGRKTSEAATQFGNQV